MSNHPVRERETERERLGPMSEDWDNLLSATHLSPYTMSKQAFPHKKVPFIAKRDINLHGSWEQEPRLRVPCKYGAATINWLLQIIRLFCKIAL